MPSTGKKIQSFGNWSPRVSATYDLFGNGKTSVHASGSYYYDDEDHAGGRAQRPVHADGADLGPEPVERRLQRDGERALLERRQPRRHGPGQRADRHADVRAARRFNLNTGVLTPAGNIVDPSAKIGRTREAIVGIQHELIPNLAVGVDYIYRKYDRGTTTYTIGYQPGAPGYPLSQIYTGPLTYTDPVTGLSAPYYQICQGCSRPSGLGSITMTNPNYQVYHGVDLTATKRYSNRWQMQAALTMQTNPQYFPRRIGDTSSTRPGQEFQDGYSTIAKYILKVNGSYTLPWDISASANFNSIQGGDVARVTINGPGAIYGGVNAAGAATTISTNTLELEPQGIDTVQAGEAARPRAAEGAEVRVEVPDQADAGCVQHLQHQHHHRLLERQQEPGRLHPADHDHRATGLPHRHEVLPSDAARYPPAAHSLTAAAAVAITPG